MAAASNNSSTKPYEPKTMITAPNTTKPGCQSRCGNLTVPYPFGIGSGCAFNSTFEIICDTSTDPPLALFTPQAISPSLNPLVIINISDTELRVQNRIIYSCLPDLPPQFFSSPQPLVARSDPVWYPFPLSHTANKFVAMGCGGVTIQYLKTGPEDDALTITQCTPSCYKDQGCGGEGCCQTAIPAGVSNYTFVSQFMSVNLVDDPHPCIYAFLGEWDEFHFTGTSGINDPTTFTSRVNITSVPLVLDWAIGNENCSMARMNRTSYACQQNTDCTDAGIDTGSRVGYRCSCLPGFEGNPYLSPAGCTDIDECADPSSNSCSGICNNTEGSYECSCPPGYSGDGKKNGKGCVRIQRIIWFPLVNVVAGLSLGLLFLIAGGTWMHFVLKKHKHMKLKKRFFEQNGGLFLKQMLSSSDNISSLDATMIFSIEDLSSATGNFSDDCILGQGGQGTVYRGILNKQVLAIKKARVADKNQVEQFINEVVLLTRINHRNVVKLLGCCLEARFPMLVYEFIPNGTLYDHIHAPGGGAYWLSWANILRIGTEVANALAYLHSAASIPIIHRDIKSKNILLDETCTAKVSDFGASRLIPLNQTQLSTVVQGTRGYLDPEYHSSGQLTEKSDVYSFGVVLAELLTWLEPFDRKREHENLATMFATSMAEGRLFDILDTRLVKDAPKAPLMAVAEQVLKCISTKREDRPTMKEVAMELERLRKPAELEKENQSCDQELDLYPIVVLEIGLLDYDFE